MPRQNPLAREGDILFQSIKPGKTDRFGQVLPLIGRQGIQILIAVPQPVFGYRFENLLAFLAQCNQKLGPVRVGFVGLIQ